MADQIRTFRIELEAGFTSWTKGFSTAGKSVDGLSKSLDKFSAAQAGAERGPARLGAALESSSQRAGRFADAVGRVSTTLARSADSFGLPTQALRTLDDAADIAELGLGNLTKGLAGFNAATLGVIGAGAALGAALGSFANRFESVRKFADDATRGLYDFLAANKLFGEATRDQGAGQEAGLAQFRLAMQAKQIEAIKTQIKNQRELGATTEQLAKLYKGVVSPAILEQLGLSEKQVKAEVKATEAAKKAADEFKKLTDQLSGVTAQKELDQLSLAFDKLGVDGVADLEALRSKLEQLQKQGAKITSKGLLGVLSGGKIEIPKELGELDLGIALPELDPAVLAQSQQSFNAMAQSAAAAGLSTQEMERALEQAGASSGQVSVALATIPVTFGSVFKQTMSQLPQVILSAFQGGGDVGKSIGSFFGGSMLEGLAGENGPLGKASLSKIFGSTFGGALNAILPGLGSILGAGLGSLFDKIGGLFGGKSDVSKARDQYFAQWSDGFVGLQQELVGTIGAVGQQDFVKQLFDAKSVDEFNRIVAMIKETLAKVGEGVEPVTIPVNYEVTNAPAGTVDPTSIDLGIEGFREGTRGFVNFGEGTLAMLHGWEAVVPMDGGGDMVGGDTFNVTMQIEENPLQTFESVQRQRDFTLKTVRRDMGRSLAQAVASGRA